MTHKTLLQQANDIETGNGRPRKKVTSEHIELAIAWAKGDVGLSQIAEVVGVLRTNTYGFLAITLREAVRRGKLK